MRKSVLLVIASLFLFPLSLDAQNDKPKKATAKKECCAEKRTKDKKLKMCCEKRHKDCKWSKETKDSTSVK